jgi:hypothetical protein
MESPVDSLQMITIKNMFGSLNDVEKKKLVEDLLKASDYEYVKIENRSSQRDYRDNFIRFMMEYWSRHYNRLTSTYIDECFAVWKLLEEQSVGDEFGSICEIGDWFLTAVDLNHTNGTTHIFESPVSRLSTFQYDIFTECRPDLVELVIHFSFGVEQFDFIREPAPQNIVQINLRLTNLFDLLLSAPEDAYMMLGLFGYFKSDEVRLDAYAEKFLEVFPERKTLKDILTHEKVELRRRFRVDM